MNDTPVRDDMDMEQLLSQAAPEGRAGAVVEARVVEASPEGLLVDVGLKQEGFIPMAEFRSLARPPAVGETFPAVIKRVSGPEGRPLVSWREARDRAHWDRVAKAKDAGESLEGRVVKVVKGGLVVDLGLEGFLPASQLDRRPVKDPKVFVGQTLKVLVLEMDRAKGNVVVSHRAWLEREALSRKADTLKDMAAGKVYTGTVTGLASFGAFVDIGGVEGLLRLPEVSWTRVDKISDALSVGQEIQVKVLKCDAATGKVSLGRKQLLPHPWEGAPQRYAAGAVVKGRVTHLADFGVFVELEPGVEGLVHQSELSWQDRQPKPSDLVKKGQEVSVWVLSVDATQRKISLSLKRAASNPWRDPGALPRVGTRVKGQVTHLSPFGAFVRLSSGIEGLLRTEDISWTRVVRHPKDCVAPGQEVEVVVLEADPRAERLSLGLKQLQPDPFTRYKPGEAVEGKVLRFTDFGAVVEIGPDVEAFLHVSEISGDRDRRLGHPSEALQIGQAVSAEVTKLQRNSKRIDISIVKHDRRQEKKLLQKYRGGGDAITLGEMIEWEGSAENGREP